MRLKPLPEGRFYCGPSAIAAFTGEHPKGLVRSTINKIRYRKETQGIAGMWLWEIKRTLRELEVHCSAITHFEMKNRPTLKAFVTEHKTSNFIVEVSGHFIAVSEGWCMDNQSCIPRFVAFFPGNRKKVKRYLEIFF